MGLRIQNHPASLIAIRNLGIASDLVRKSTERISSGLRINRASDDPAGLVLSESLRAEARALQASVANAQFAQSFISTTADDRYACHSRYRPGRSSS